MALRRIKNPASLQEMGILAAKQDFEQHFAKQAVTAPKRVQRRPKEPAPEAEIRRSGRARAQVILFLPSKQ